MCVHFCESQHLNDAVNDVDLRLDVGTTGSIRRPVAAPKRTLTVESVAERRVSESCVRKHNETLTER
uniref:Uncharacterized protein n=1 Tax=Angiostrongylus cantonensis TaxID=6313 RepID=A0A0K0CUH1_ANGCA